MAAEPGLAPDRAPDAGSASLDCATGWNGACRISACRQAKWVAISYSKKVSRTLISAAGSHRSTDRSLRQWIDESNPRQFKAVLQVLGDQMTYADPLCRRL